VALLGWGGSLEDKITYNKGTLIYPSGVIATESLLVAGKPYHSSVPLFLEHVDVCLALFLCSLLIVEVDARSVKVEVRGDTTSAP
jgi:hypothetical protein